MPLIPRTDLNVSPISLGAGDLGTKVVGDDADRLLDAYIELGGNFLDTAHCYACWVPGGIGVSERALGDWMRRSGNRASVVVASKGGHPPMDIYPHAADFLSPEAILQDATESFERLGTSTIDLYYLHRDDGVTPVSEIIDALNSVEGLRYLGASNWSIGRAAEANAYAQEAGKRGFVALQSQWSLAVPTWSMGADPTVRYVTELDAGWCAANAVAIHAYSSTANGYFELAPDKGPFAANASRHGRVGQLAAERGMTPTQVALAWLLSQPGTVVPIIGTTKVDRVREAFGAVGHRFDAEALGWLLGGAG